MGINNPELHGSAIPIELALRYAQSETGDESDSVAEPPVPEEKPEFVKPAPPKLGTTSKKVSFKNLAHSFVRQISIQDIEKEQVELCPKVEGRIFQYDEQRKQKLLDLRGPVSPNIMDEIIQTSSDEMNRRNNTFSSVVDSTRNIQETEPVSSGSEMTDQGLKRKLPNDNNNAIPSDIIKEAEVKKTKLN